MKVQMLILLIKRNWKNPWNIQDFSSCKKAYICNRDNKKNYR